MTSPSKPKPSPRRKPTAAQHLPLDLAAEAQPAGQPAADPKPKRSAKMPAARSATAAEAAVLPAAGSEDAAPAPQRTRAARTAPKPTPAAEPVAVAAAPASANASTASAEAPTPQAAASEPVAASVASPVSEPEPVVASQPTPTPEPVLGAAAAPTHPPAAAGQQDAPGSQSAADAGFRYHRRPPPEPVERPVQRTPPRPVQSWRQRPDDPAAAAPAPSGPRQLDMAELAARRRQSYAVEKEAEAPQPQRREPLDLQQRAARYTKPVDEPVQKAEATPVRARPEHVDSIARAAEATRHKRVAEGPSAAEASAPAAAVDVLRSAALVLVTRNHESLVGSQLAAWRGLLQRSDLRFAVLDLGSTDRSAELASELAGVKLVVVPGGLVAPFDAVQAVVAQVPADDLLFADADAAPDAVALALWQALRAGAAAAASPRQHPQLVALAAEKWRAAPNGAHPAGVDWIDRHGGVVYFGAEHAPARPWGFATALLRRPLAARVQRRVHRFYNQLRARFAL